MLTAIAPELTSEHWQQEHERRKDCEYCDWFPSYQRYREIAGIAFTGQTPAPGQVPCPSEERRPLVTINRWPGNRPSPIQAGAVPCICLDWPKPETPYVAVDNATHHPNCLRASGAAGDPDWLPRPLFGDTPVDIDGTPLGGPSYTGR